MKKIVTILLLSCISFSGLCATKSLQAFFSYSTFYAPNVGSYAETYLSIQGGSIVWMKNSAGKFQGSVQVTMYFKQNGEIKDFKKYEVLSPEISDTTNTNIAFLDQQRIVLPNGTYDFELEIADRNQAKAPFTILDKFSIDYDSERLLVSGIEFVEFLSKSKKNNQLTKSGYDVVPYLDNFFPISKKKLTFYAEIYNAEKVIPQGETYTITTFIESVEAKIPLDSYSKIKKETPHVVNVLISEFDISNLNSGNYNLVIKVQNKDNQELARKSIFFQRSNPNPQLDVSNLANIDILSSFVRNYQDTVVLREMLRMLYPIASISERLFIDTQTETADLATLQRFFHAFWALRNQVQPEVAWNAYYENVLAVNAEFSTARKKGYETDRGRVYLKYGPPNTRVGETMDPRTYPYEIWHYYKAGTQTDRRFVFCTRDIVVNDYQLIHSTVTGEIYDQSWQYVVIRVNRPIDANDDPKAKLDSYWGGSSGDFYNTPR